MKKIVFLLLSACLSLNVAFATDDDDSGSTDSDEGSYSSGSEEGSTSSGEGQSESDEEPSGSQEVIVDEE